MRRMVKLALVVSAKGACNVSGLNDALHAQEFDPARLEVHVVQDLHSTLDGPLPVGVRTHRLEQEASVFELWGHGVCATQAEYVAILDIHCPPAPGWLEAVEAKLLGRPDALSGPVEPAYSWQDERIVGYLAEYVQFHRPTAVEMMEVAGNNLVLRRELAGSAEVLGRGGFIKTHLLPRLAAPPEYLPQALVLHAKPIELTTYAQRRFRHARCYAAQRKMRAGQRAGAVLKTLALPGVRVWRIAKHCDRHPAAREAFWRFLPHLLIVESAWSLGELVGYIGGEGSCRPKLD